MLFRSGATRIYVRIKDGGKSLIEVADDGSGIPASEVPLAVERYSTSKLRSADDLGAIKTLGFRGEALSSIAAVSRMELISRHAGESVGSKLIVAGGEIGEVEPIGSTDGTTVRVRDLFYNVPARAEFLKTDSTERRWISRLIDRYADRKSTRLNSSHSSVSRMPSSA